MSNTSLDYSDASASANSISITFEQLNKDPARLSLRSPLTGRIHTIETNIYSQEDFDRRWHAFSTGTPIDEAFPLLSTNFKNFIVTGVPDFEWEEYDIKGSNIDVGMSRYYP